MHAPKDKRIKDNHSRSCDRPDAALEFGDGFFFGEAGAKGIAVLLISASQFSSRSLMAFSFSGLKAARSFSSAMSLLRL